MAAPLSVPAISKDAAVTPRKSLLLTPVSVLAGVLSLAGDCAEASLWE